MREEDIAYIQQAKSKLREWSSDIVTELINSLKEDTTFFPKLKSSGHDIQQFETEALEWYRLFTNASYDEYYWEKVWKLGLLSLKAEIRISQIMAISHYVRLSLRRRIFETYREASAASLIQALSHLITCTSSIVAEAAYSELFSCVEKAGIRKPILQRMINLEVDQKTKN